MKCRAKTPLAYLMALAMLIASGGASCQRRFGANPFTTHVPPPPSVLMSGAGRDQIVAAVNQNSARIQSLTVTGAAITIPGTLGLPILSGNIAAQRPGRFRMTAGTAVGGQEIDVGSNDELFWLWARRNQPPAVYFCQHSQFAQSNIRDLMPVEPSWLLSALGMIDIDPASVFDGPTPRRDGMVELRTWLPSASGNLPRVLVIDSRTACVSEQYVYDVRGTLLASAVAEWHRYCPEQQISLPGRLSIQLPTAGLSFKIDLGAVAVNQLAGDQSQLWTMPAFAGFPQYDLGGAVQGTPLPGPVHTAPMPLSARTDSPIAAPVSTMPPAAEATSAYRVQ